jgi:hypothetical protein
VSHFHLFPVPYSHAAAETVLPPFNRPIIVMAPPFFYPASKFSISSLFQSTPSGAETVPPPAYHMKGSPVLRMPANKFSILANFFQNIRRKQCKISAGFFRKKAPYVKQRRKNSAAVSLSKQVFHFR